MSQQIWNDNFQSVEVTSKSIQIDTNLLKKEFEILNEVNRSLSNMTPSTEQNLEKMQANIKNNFAALEEGTAYLACKLQSLPVGAKILNERFQTAKCINRISSKGYGRLMDRISIQEVTIHAMKILYKFEILSLTDKLHTLKSFPKALEKNTGQEIQALQKAMAYRLKKLEEIIDSNEQEQKVERQNLTPSVSKPLQDTLPRVLPAFPVITSER